MLVLGHAGITLGAAAVLAGAVKNHHSPKVGRVGWFTALSSYVDIRVLLLGSLLPDIIDKPVGQFFFRETFNNGRIFSHTLTFVIVLAVAGFYLFRRYRQVWLLTIAFGAFMHLALDQMWYEPGTLFWPFLGISFSAIELTGWLSSIFDNLVSNPVIYASELVGLAVLLCLALIVVSRKRIGLFIRSGKIG
jgi:inner membrane protein